MSCKKLLSGLKEPGHAALAGHKYTRFLMKIQALKIPIIIKANPPSAHKLVVLNKKQKSCGRVRGGADQDSLLELSPSSLL